MNSIVVIEDDPAILRGLSDTLRAESYEVLAAADGEVGYRIALDKQPDLVILDLNLPGMNGYDVCREIRRHGMATPILMLTAQDRETNRVEGFEAGADDYVTKPFSIRELLGRVRAILRRSEGRADLANQKELDAARRIQERLMPSEIPQAPGFHIAATWRPARIVGGDYYDVFPLSENRIAVSIGDVCGKGMPAAMLMSNLQAAVKAYATTHTSPGELCGLVNRAMFDNLAAQSFISFFYGVLDVEHRRFTYSNAGHNPPLIAGPGSGSECLRLECGGLVLGVMNNANYKEDSIALQHGSRILMYTDGITECANSANEEFGEPRLRSIVAGSRQTDAGILTESIIRAATEFSGGHFDDDLTVVAVTIE